MGLTFAQYEDSVKDSLAKYIRDKESDDKYTELILGLYEEAAEVTSPIRRSIKGNFHEEEIDISHLGEEVGDVLWYISQISIQLPDCSLTKIALKNLKKTHLNYRKDFKVDESMSISAYTQGVLETYRTDLPSLKQDRARFFCLGLIKEIGKVSELFGEHRIDGNVLNMYKIEEKLGDALWYLSAISETYELRLEDIALNNIQKVHGRYNVDGTVRANSDNKEELEI